MGSRARWSGAAALAAVGALLAVVPAAGHLRNVGGSLLDLLVRSDALVLVEVVRATTDAPAETRVRTKSVLGGLEPPGEVSVANALSPMRYETGQHAVVALERDEETWRAVQLTGEGLVLDESELDAETASYLEALWTATHDAASQGDLGRTLRGGLRLPHRQLRLWAALDLAELAHHRPGLSADVRKALAGDLEDPDLDPAVRMAVERALDGGPSAPPERVGPAAELP